MAQLLLDKYPGGVRRDDQLVARGERLDHLGDMGEDAYMVPIPVEQLRDRNSQIEPPEPVADVVPEKVVFSHGIVRLLYLGHGIGYCQGIVRGVIFGKALEPYHVAVPAVDDRPIKIEGYDLFLFHRLYYTICGGCRAAWPRLLQEWRALRYLLISI